MIKTNSDHITKISISMGNPFSTPIDKSTVKLWYLNSDMHLTIPLKTTLKELKGMIDQKTNSNPKLLYYDDH